MKNIFTIILTTLCFQSLSAQVKPSITLDPSTGNYIIRYQGGNGQEQEIEYEPATKIEPLVKASVYYNNGSDLCKYEYTITNGENSKQRLFSFSVEKQSSVFSINKPNKDWHIGQFYYRPIVDWYNSKGSGGLSNPYDGIAPDSSASGFSFQSSGLPTIVSSFFEGTAKGLGFPDEPPMEIEEMLDPLIRFPANTVQRKTLGPKDPPDPFIITAFLDTLVSYKHQALDLGWITNKGIANSLDKKLENARKQLEKGKVKQAINMLNAFLNEVEAQKDKHLTSEAYALLKFNVEYLIQKLEED